MSRAGAPATRQKVSGNDEGGGENGTFGGTGARITPMRMPEIQEDAGLSGLVDSPNFTVLTDKLGPERIALLTDLLD